MLLIDLINKFLRYCSLEENLRPKTTQCLKSCLFSFVKRMDIESINQVTLALLQEFFYEGKEKYQWSDNTHRNYYNNLSKFFKWCIANKYIKKDPMKNLQKAKRAKRLPRRLSLENAQKILFTTFNYNWKYKFEVRRNYTIIAVFLYTGIRANELLNLKVTDINLNIGNIFIELGKGGKDRNIPIHYKLMRILQNYLEERKSLKKTSEYLFTGVRSNKTLSYKNLGKICQKIAKESGIHFTPHCLRHTYGSVSIEQGLDIVKLKEMMGHSDISSTMVYLKMSSNNLKESVNKLDLF